MKSGFTLLELLFVLALTGLLSASLVSPARGLADRFAVVAARDGIAGMVARARSIAPYHWGSILHISEGPWRAWTEAGDSVIHRVDLESELGVTVTLSRERSATQMEFDALGLGRMAGETLVFRRGDAEAVLVISAYGRTTSR
jgi:prepilin-type N-terminal cleavage/methylation domain-containing protein